jgi:threonine/homoserine/homoserine lactone efflux protein
MFVTMFDFIPSLTVLSLFTLASFVLFLTPGPDMSLWLSKTISGGRSAGIAAMAGTNLGCCVHSVLAAFGISVLINASPVAFNIMKVIGAGYLFWLAYQAIRKGSMLNANLEKGQSTKMALLPTFLSGLTVNLSNPKVVLFFVTFLPGFVEASDPHVRGKLLFLGLYFVAINIPFSAIFILIAGRLVSNLKSNPKIMRGIDYLFAGVFGIFALTIIRAQART